MKLIGKHCLATPKAGITTATKIWKGISVKGKSNYKFLQGRNPYHRYISIYAHKFMDINANRVKEDGIDPLDFRAREINDLRREVSKSFDIKKHGSMREFTVKTFLTDLLHRKKPMDFEVHISPQAKDRDKFRFNDIIFLHDLPEAYLIPAEKLEIELDLTEVTVSVKTNRSNSLDLTQNDVLNMTVEEWWKLGAIPNDYSLFYDDELLDGVYEYYKEDFIMLDIAKGEL